MKEQEIIRIREPKKGEIFGFVIEILGAGKLRVECEDGLTRMCRIPGKLRKKIWVRINDLVLVKPWEIEPKEKADIAWRYTATEANWMKRKGYIKNINF